jgi:hypothetical protein
MLGHWIPVGTSGLLFCLVGPEWVPPALNNQEVAGQKKACGHCAGCDAVVLVQCCCCAAVAPCGAQAMLLLCYAVVVLCCCLLCNVMLWYGMVWYAMLCCVVLCHAMSCYGMLCHAMPCRAVPCYWGSMLHGHFRQTTMALPTRVEPGEPHKL